VGHSQRQNGAGRSQIDKEWRYFKVFNRLTDTASAQQHQKRLKTIKKPDFSMKSGLQPNKFKGQQL
jgi:hypothetical protein